MSFARNLLGYSRVSTLRRACMVALVIAIVLLVASYYPDTVQRRSSSLLLEDLRAVDDAGKVSDEVVGQLKEALHGEAVGSSDGRVVVLLEAGGDVSRPVAASGGRVVSKAGSLDGEREFVSVELPARNLPDVAADERVIRVLPVRTYYAVLDSSVPLVKPRAFWNSGFNGSGVKVAVLDTGVDSSHSMLKGRVVAERDFTNSGSASDRFGHGTHVAGIVAGLDSSYSGVAPGARIINAKVLGDNGFGDTVGIIAGVVWAVENGADIISLSLGANAPMDEALESTIRDAVGKGVVFVVASGNCGSSCPSAGCGSFTGVSMPGSSPSVITVGAVDDSRSVACFSGGGVVPGVGVKPDFVAPGVDVTSAALGGGYVALDGTSMATPHVSGAVALLLGRNPSLSQDDVRRILERTALDLGPAGKDAEYGFGLPDLEKAFIYREDLEFSLGLQRRIVQGSGQLLNVSLSDDVVINNITGSVTSPAGVKSSFAFARSGSSYVYEYQDTASVGTYLVDVIVDYGGNYAGSSIDNPEMIGAPGLKSFYSGSFDVVSPLGEFVVASLNVSPIQFLSQNLTGSVVFDNSASSALVVSSIVQLVNSSVAVQEFRLPSASLPSGRSSLVFSLPLDVAAGNYTLRVLADYMAGDVLVAVNVSVADDLPPRVVSVSHSSSVNSSSPITVSAELLEHSDVYPQLELYAGIPCDGVFCTKAFIPQIPVNYTSVSVDRGSGRKQVSASVFEFVPSGKYYLYLRFCDGFGNCDSFSRLDVNVTPCPGSRVVLLKAAGSSAFEGNYPGVCLSVVDTGLSGLPPQGYLSGFDGLVWSSGSDFAGISDASGQAISDFYAEKGAVVVEGGDVAFRRRNDEFMHSVLHAELAADLGFSVASLSELSGLAVAPSRPHPIIGGGILAFNSSVDSFPDAISPFNGSVELARWSGLAYNGSAMVAFEDGYRKSLFIPFSLAALNESERRKVAANSVSWLVSRPLGDVYPLGLNASFAFEGNVSLGISMFSAGLVEPFEAEVLADGAKVAVGIVSGGPGNFSFPFSAPLGVGVHRVSVIANPRFVLPEANYVNNLAEFNITVYPRSPDLVFSGMDYSFSKPDSRLFINLTVSNFGGTAAGSVVSAYSDGQPIGRGYMTLAAYESRILMLLANSSPGVHEFSAVVANSSVAEYNESNNNLNQTIFLCDRARVLVVEDDSGLFFSTSSPGSAGFFLDALLREGYCAEFWRVSERGWPSMDYLESFRAVVWSLGNYYGGSSSYLDYLAGFNGGIVVEGSDAALDSSNALGGVAGVAFGSDLMANSSEQLLLSSHAVAARLNASSISISGERAPYPDIIELLSAEPVASWERGGYAIAARDAVGFSRQRAVFFGFSVDAVSDENLGRRLAASAMDWLLRNSPPVLLAADSSSVYEAAPAVITVLAGDVDGDNLTFSINDSRFASLGNGSFSWLTGYADAGVYDVLVGVSDSAGSSFRKVSLEVLNLNRPPVVAAVNRVVTENSSLEFELSAFDPDGDAVVFSSSGLPSGASMSGSRFSWVPGFSQAGEYAINFLVSDGSVNLTVPVNVSVQNLNLRPAFANSSFHYTVREGFGLSVYLPALDADGDAVSFNSSGLPYGASLASDGLFYWRPSYIQKGNYSIPVGVSDRSLYDSSVVVVSVLDSNRPPQISVDAPGSVAAGQLVSFSVDASDPDGDQVFLSSNDAALVLDGRRFAWNTSLSGIGAHDFVFTASDGLLSGSVALRVVVLPSAGSSEKLITGISVSTENPAWALISLSTASMAGCRLRPSFCSSGVCSAGFWTPFDMSGGNSHYHLLSTSQAGNYSIAVDCANSSAQESDNFNFTAGLGADLSVHELLPANVTLMRAGDFVEFTVRIRNSGGWSSGSNVGWYLDSVLVNTSAVAGMWPGRELLVAGFAWNATVGNHSVRAVAAGFDANSSNNELVYAFAVEPPVSGMADLYPVHVNTLPVDRPGFNSSSLYYYTVYQGERVFFDTAVANRGHSATRRFNVRWYLDGSLVGAGGHAGLQARALLAGGNSQYLLNSSSLGIGTHNLTFIIDPSNLVNESDEGNNRLSYLFEVAPGPAPISVGEMSVVNGRWGFDGSSYFVDSFGFGSHPIAVGNYSFRDGVVVSEVSPLASAGEAAVCGRMNLSGYGYCLGLGWGSSDTLALGRQSGYPFNPAFLNGSLVSYNSSEPVLVKMAFDNSSIRGKAFTRGVFEPSWQVEYADPIPASGSMGFSTYLTPSSFYNYAWRTS